LQVKHSWLERSDGISALMSVDAPQSRAFPRFRLRESSTLQLSTSSYVYLLPIGFYFQRFRNGAPSPCLASRLHCDRWRRLKNLRNGKTHDFDTSYRMPLFDRLPFPWNSCWRLSVPRNNQHKEANDHGIISDREVWSAIRYLDPESDPRESDVAAAIALSAVVCIVCLVRALLLLRGL
jgi:hypothetical protein